MNYLLDTCTVSEIIKPQPNTGCMTWLDAQSEDDLFLSSITIGELYKGQYKLIDKKRQQSLKNWIENELMDRFRGRVLSYDLQVAHAWGKINGENEQKGKKLSILDSQIMAIALTHNLVVVTRNLKDMQISQIKTINPWS